jgi:NitT/TauT family transport system substrate-binding protein
MVQRWLRGGLSVLAALALATPALAQTPVKIGIGFGLGFLPLLIADELDLVEKYAKEAGLSVTASYPRYSGSAAMQEAMATGAVDMGVYGVPALLIAWDKGRGTQQQVLGIAGVNSSPLVLLTNKPGAKSLADLGSGDKIAVPALGSPQMYILQMAAEKAFGHGQHDRLRPQVVSLAHAEALKSILSETSPVKAYFSAPPFTQIALESGKVSAILSSHDVLGGRASFLVLGAGKGYLDANPKLAEAMVKVLLEAADLIKRDPKKAAEIYLKAEPSRTLTAERIEALLKTMTEDFGVEVYGIEAYAAFMGRIGVLKTVPANFKDVFLPHIHATASN